jgi:hypothetical protein
MAPTSDSSILQARAASLQRRAENLAGRPGHPFTHDQIALVALAAREARGWIQESQVLADPSRLPCVEETLLAQEERLDGLESLLSGIRTNADALRDRETNATGEPQRSRGKNG